MPSFQDIVFWCSPRAVNPLRLVLGYKRQYGFKLSIGCLLSRKA